MRDASSTQEREALLSWVSAASKEHPRAHPVTKPAGTATSCHSRAFARLHYLLVTFLEAEFPIYESMDSNHPGNLHEDSGLHPCPAEISVLRNELGICVFHKYHH